MRIVVVVSALSLLGAGRNMSQSMSRSANTGGQSPGESFRMELDFRILTFGVEIKTPRVDLITQEEYEK